MPSLRLTTVVSLAAVGAVLSLLLPLEPVFDPWAWLVWGREGIGLDTSGGPSWKPLPVIVDWPLSLLGDAAPQLWLLVVRTGGLATVAFAAMLAARIAADGTGGVRPRVIWAAALAALGVVAQNDPLTSWTRQLAGGLGEPLLLAAVLGGVELHLRGRLRGALLAALAAALLRPEAWIPLALYGAWLWSANPGLRRSVAACAVAVPVLWFLPDLLASGDPLTGAGRAAEADGGTSRLVGATLDGLGLAPWAFLAGAAWTARRGFERGEATTNVLAAGAGLWFGTVLVLTLLGFPGLSRFFIPFAGIVCVLGAAGIVDLGARALAAGRRRSAALAALGLVLVGGELGLRLTELPGDYRSAAAYGRSVDDLFALVDRVGRGRLLGCGPLASSDVLTQPALAWKLQAPLARVDVVTRRPPSEGLFITDQGAPAELLASIREIATPISSSAAFTLYEISCSARASAFRGAAPAGVRGAAR